MAVRWQCTGQSQEYSIQITTAESCQDPKAEWTVAEWTGLNGPFPTRSGYCVRILISNLRPAFSSQLAHSDFREGITGSDSELRFNIDESDYIVKGVSRFWRGSPEISFCHLELIDIVAGVLPAYALRPIHDSLILYFCDLSTTEPLTYCFKSKYSKYWL